MSEVLNNKELDIIFDLIGKWHVAVGKAIKVERDGGKDITNFHPNNTVWVWPAGNYHYYHIFIRIHCWLKSDLLLCSRCFAMGKITIYTRRRPGVHGM